MATACSMSFGVVELRVGDVGPLDDESADDDVVGVRHAHLPPTGASVHRPSERREHHPGVMVAPGLLVPDRGVYYVGKALRD